MKRHRNLQLSFNKETIRVLTEQKLRDIQGAARVTLADACTFNTGGGTCSATGLAFCSK